jgi:DUF971 family protein
MTQKEIWPTQLTLSQDKKSLFIEFEGGESFTLSAEYLRVESPSAEVQGHSPTERKFISGKKNVAIMTLEPVGHYAVRINFDDMHNTGLYAWDFLYKLGKHHEKIWEKYLEGLANSGGIRERLKK